MGVWLANAERLATETMATVINPPPPVEYLSWAEANIVFSDRESQFPGPYNRALFPYFDEILRALGPDDPCRTVTLMKSAQIGGTVLANIFTGGSLAMDPGDFLYVHPTDDNARRWSKMKLAPMLRGTTALSRIFSSKSRDGADSVMYKERVDGLGAIQISGANSPASLSQVSMRRQVQDDLAKWEMNSAGDPETQANSRSRGYEFAKIFKISTPLVMPGCRITANFEAGSQEHLYVPCPHCQHMQTLDWENMLANLDEAQPENACFACTECGAIIEEHHRDQMLRGHEWRAHNPGARRYHRSFYLWSAYSFLQSWERIAREWLDAKGDAGAERVFLNDTVGKAYKAAGEAPPWETLRDRAEHSAYTPGIIPAGGLVLTIGIDCQKDRVEWQAVAYGRDYRRFVVEYGVIPGHIAEPETQQRLDDLVRQSWPNSVGHRIEADRVAIDGNAWTEDVWSWAKSWPISKVIMVRGRGEDSAPLLAKVKRERHRKTGRLLRYSGRFYNFGTSVLKMALYRNLAKTEPLAAGFVAFPNGLGDEYFRQLTAERRVEVKSRAGFVTYRWEKDASQPNEGLDTHLQSEAAAINFGIRGMPDATWDRLEAERETPPDTPQLDLEDLFRPAPTAATPPPAAQVVGAPTETPPATKQSWLGARKGWLNGPDRR